MTSPGHGKGRRALDALSELARGSARPPTTAELDSGLDTLRSRMEAEQPHRRSARQSSQTSLFLWSLVVALAAMAGLVAVGLVRPRSPTPAAPPALAYRVEGGSIVEGAYLRASSRAGTKPFYAEGTEFILMTG